MRMIRKFENFLLILEKDVYGRKTKKILSDRDMSGDLYILERQKKMFPKNEMFGFSIMRKVKKLPLQRGSFLFAKKLFIWGNINVFREITEKIKRYFFFWHVFCSISYQIEIFVKTSRGDQEEKIWI